ncbi:MAG: UDP-N-acetylmuramoyl-tripeptide--D-alanyl-D-alanine ligase [Phycisphaerales bacterium]
MSRLSLQGVADATGGRWAVAPSDPNATITGVSTDTRTIKPNELFLALVGPNHDGHDHARAAVEAGASCVIAMREVDSRGMPALLVKDTRRALADLARAHRATLTNATVIAVTGSNGKTTTSRLLAGVLAERGTVHASPKSFNNDIGVPLTILGASRDAETLICEVGTNAPGEIAPLAEIIRPDIAVITSIGRAHLEALGSREGIAEEKSAIFGHLSESGLAIIPADEPLLRRVHDGKRRVVTFGASSDADIRVSEVRHEPCGGGMGVRFTINGSREFLVPLAGVHNAMNASIAVAVGQRLGMSDELIRRGLLNVDAPEDRLRVRVHGGVTLVNDAYNANPDSMLAALHAFHELSVGATRRVLVIGSMAELGAQTRGSHEELAERIAEVIGPDVLVTVGEAARTVHDAARELLPDARREHFDTLTDEIARRIAGVFGSGDAVLLKGSRTNALERIERALADVTDDASSCSTG